MGKIVRLGSLSKGEAVRIEGNIARYSDSELEGMLPSGASSVSLKSSLARGEFVVISDSPSVPLFKFSNGKLVANASNQITLTDQASNEAKQRFLSNKQRAGVSRAADSSEPAAFSEASYTPEPVVAEPPPQPLPPTTISENFAKPAQTDKVFAKSCTRPYGDTQACEEELKAPNFGVMAAMAPAQALTANGQLPLGKVAGSTSRMPLNWAVAGDLAKSTLSRVNFLVLAFWPSQLGDGTIFSAEELEQMSSAATRVRFRLYKDENDNPQVVGIHTGEGSAYGDTVKVLAAKANGETFEAVVDSDLTLTWFPDDSDSVLTAGTSFPDTSGLEITNILVRPIEDDGQELKTLVYPNPKAHHIELIVTFPADSGIDPLYLVFSRPTKPKVKPLEVGTYGDLAPRSKKDGMDIDHIPSMGALLRAAEALYGDILTSDMIKELKNTAAGIAIPSKVHQKCSETYGGRNQPDKQIEDAENLEKAVDSNFDAIEKCLQQEGYTQEQLDESREKLHDINKQNGWY